MWELGRTIRRDHRNTEHPLGAKHKRGASRCCVVWIIGAMSFMLLGGVDGNCADVQPVDRNFLLTLKQGEVTANNGEELLIDNIRYAVLPTATVTDDEGRSREWKQVIPGAQVRFQLQQNKIVQLVIMLPR
jgi:hypothetical protein